MDFLHTLPDHCLQNKDQFHRLYHAYAPKVYGVILRFIQDEAEACIVLQSVFAEMCSMNNISGKDMSEISAIRLTLQKIRAHKGPELSVADFREKVATAFVSRPAYNS